MRWGPLAVFVALIAACGGGDDGGDTADARADEPADASVPFGCVGPALRAQKTLTVSGTVIDYVTGEPVPGATVDVSTAWDVAGGFPDACPPITTFTTNADGQFGAQLIEMGSPIDPPIMLFMVRGAGLTPTSSDQTSNSCQDGDCGFMAHTIAVPAKAVGDAWRSELEAGGMGDAATRGLTVFEYRELDLAPAPDVVPWRLVGLGQVDLMPGTEVRFLAADRASLQAADATQTTTAGVAIIGVDTSAGSARVGGARDAQRWNDLGVLFPPGWLFLEDRRMAP